MLLNILLLTLYAIGAAANEKRREYVCTIAASGTNLTDDAPAIRAAFKECKSNARIVFTPTTYYINTELDIRGLENVDIDIQGELLVRSG